MSQGRRPRGGVFKVPKKCQVQVGLVIRGRYVLLFWIANTEFADKKTHFDWKFGLSDQFFISEFADKKTADNEVHLYT